MTTELQGLGNIATPTFRAHLQVVRLFFRDFAELNQVIRGEESSDRYIAWATLDFLSDFNGTPPFTGYTLEDIYARQLQSFAVRGTAIALLQSVMLLYIRNAVPFSDGGISISWNDKAPIIQATLQLFQSSYEQQKRTVKTAINVESLLGVDSTGLFSDYSAVMTGFGYY